MNNISKNILILLYNRIYDSIICFSEGEDETIKEQKFNPDEDYLKIYSKSQINLCVLSENGSNTDVFLKKHKDYLYADGEIYWINEKISESLSRISEKLRLFKCNYNDHSFGKGGNVKKFSLVYPSHCIVNEQIKSKTTTNIDEKYSSIIKDNNLEDFQKSDNTEKSEFVEFWKNIKL